MKEVGLGKLRQNTPAIVQDAASGEVVVITDRGRPVARILPLARGRLAELAETGEIRRRRHRLSEIIPAPGLTSWSVPTP